MSTLAWPIIEISLFIFNEWTVKILENNQYLHKDDITILEVVDFIITEADGTPVQNARGIFKELPEPSEYVEMIAGIISKKDKKNITYAKDLTHINLIILDTEQRLLTFSVSDFYRYFFSPQLYKILYSTGFREVFFITVIDNQRRVFYPLKLLALLANFFMFLKLLMEYPWEEKDINQNESNDTNSFTLIMMTFASYMRSKTSNIRLNINQNQQVEVIFGNVGILYEGEDVIIHDYKDYQIPNTAHKVPQDSRTTFFSSSKFIEKGKDVLGKFVFSTELAFSVKNNLHY